MDRPAAGAAAAGAAAAPDPAGAAADARSSPTTGTGGRRPLERPGRHWLAALELRAAARELIEDDLALIHALQQVIDRLDWEIRQHARTDPRVKVLTQLPGVDP